MKKFMFLFAFLALVGCGEEPEPAKPTDITGKWEFSSGVISGTLKIIRAKKLDNSYEYSITDVDTNFVIDGVSYIPDSVWPITVGDGTVDDFVLNGYMESKSGTIRLNNVTFTSDFSNLSAVSADYSFTNYPDPDTNGTVSSSIVLTRVN